MDINPYDQFDDSEEDPYAQFDSFDNPVPERTLGSTLKDTGISLAKGVIGAGQGLVGLADIPTGGRVGRGLETIGIKPDEWQADLSEEYSLAQQAANKKIDQAEGFVDTAQAMLENPSTIAHGIVETLPAVAAGGVLGRGALALGSRLAPKAVTALGKTKAAIAAGSVGEGAISAGQTAEQIRNVTPDNLLTAEQAALAAASGVGTAAFSIVGGSLAKKLGFADIDTMIIAGLNPAKKEGFKGVVKSIIGGGITEGVFEELPQSVQETIFTNAALDKPLLDGVPESAAQAIILGGVMGGGANLIPGTNRPPEKTEKELELDRRAENILNLKDDEIGQSVQKLNESLKANQDLLGNLDKLDQQARELNVAPDELIRKIVDDNKNSQDLLDRINAGIKKKEELAKKEYEALSPEEKQAKEIENKLATKRYEDASQLNERITNIDNEITTLSEQYNRKFDPYALGAETSISAEERKVIENKLIALNKRRNELLDKESPEVKKAFAPYTTRDGRQKYLEELFGTANLTQSDKVGLEKDAAESGNVFQSNIEQLNVIGQRVEQEQDLQKKKELQKLYSDLFQTFEQDATESAKVFETNQDQLDLVQQQIDQEQDLQKKQVLQKLYEGLFQNFERNAKASAEVFQVTNLVTKSGAPYKNRQYLEGIISDLPDPENYEIIESPEGFTGVKKVLDANSNSSFTNEQQVGSVPQFQVSEDQAVDKFDSLAQQQRGNPELAMIKVQQVSGGGVINPVVEHAGDLIHRMAQKPNFFKGGYEFVSEKVNKIYKWLNHPYGFEKEFNENIINNAKHRNISENQLRSDIDNALNIFADAHSKLPAYNEAHKLANSLNVAIGQQNWELARHWISELKEHVDKGEKHWESYATRNYTDSQFQATENQEALGKVNLEDIKKAFPNQEIKQSPDGSVSVKFKNGKGVTINSIQNAGEGFIKLAIETGQMSKGKSIFGITVGNEILLDENFADNKTLWHENKHVLDNLGLITEADDSALNKEFNKLRKLNKLDFALSTHEDPKQRMVENRANMFAQIMVNREAYHNTAFGKVIQRVMDFFQQLLSFGKQTVSGLAREVESGKIYERQANALREGMPMFEVRETQAEQKISDAEYKERFKQRPDMIHQIGQKVRKYGHEAKYLLDKFLGTSSSRLRSINQELPVKLINMDFAIVTRITESLEKAEPLLNKKKEMSKEDQFIWNDARNNADTAKISQIASKYGITEDWKNIRGILDQIHSDAEAVGLDMGYIEEHWPRVVKDTRGLLMAIRGFPERAIFEDALKVYAKKLKMSVEEFENTYPEQAADIVSNLILGKNVGLGRPGNTKERIYDIIPEELMQYYMDTDAALMAYIYGMTKKIEARKFFGKVTTEISALKKERNKKTAELAKYEELEKASMQGTQVDLPKIRQRMKDISGDLLRIEQELDKFKLNENNYAEHIGAYIQDLRALNKIDPTQGIRPEDERTVDEILKARFNEHGTTGWISWYKNFSYLDVMGSPFSAITQIGDQAWAMYVGEVWTPRGMISHVKNLTKATTGSFKKSRLFNPIYKAFGGSFITKEDLGQERIAQEFADSSTLGDAVSKVFKLVGLERMDSIGKETLINNAFDKYKRWLETPEGTIKLKKKLIPIFGKESERVMQDIAANNPSPNVKLLLYHTLLGFQPVGLSEMPAPYLNGGNGRIAYMLKLYTIKQFDVFRNEVYNEIKEGTNNKDKAQVINGLGNIVKLGALLALANASADEIKDWLMGKESNFSDHIIDNLWTMGGASKYVRMQTAREGLGSGVFGQILPPFKFINSISKDIPELADNYVAGDTFNFDHARIIESIPVGGKLYYWHWGRGEDYKKSSNEKEFSKVGKEVKMFKRQLENSEDKRTFLTSNLDKFKQMKMHENFQSALNRNQAVINKLKKIDQTTNVRERLGQLQQQREMILSRYFEVANTVQ